MNSRKITFILVAAFALLVVAGTKVSQLTRTRSLQETSRFLVSTQDATSGRWSSRYITAPDLATNLGPWITNSGSGGSSASITTNGNQFAGVPLSIKSGVLITNPEMRGAITLWGDVLIDGNVFSSNQIEAASISINGSSVATNIAAKLATATFLNSSNDLYNLITAAGISASTATNIARYWATNAALQASNQLELVKAPKTNATLYGTVNINSGVANEILAYDASKNLTTVSGVTATEASFIDGLGENVQDAIDELRAGQGSAAVMTNLSNANLTNRWIYSTDSFATSLTNIPSNSRNIMMPGRYAITPRYIFSNAVAQAGANLFNKSNIIIEAAVPGTVEIYATGMGDMMWFTNVYNLVLRNVTVRGVVVTNYADTAQFVDPGIVFGALNLYNCGNVVIEDVKLLDIMDHGIQGTGANINWNGASTNVTIRRVYAENVGSARTNPAPVSIDGTVVVPDGFWVIDQLETRNCLRGVEPYSDGDSSTRPWNWTVVMNSRFRNTIDSAILTAGSTNANYILAYDNQFIRDVGYTRRGSNFISSSAAIDLNGGRGHVIEQNRIEGEWSRGVYLYGGVRGVQVKQNTFVNITNSGASTGVPLDLQVAYGALIEGNTIENSEGQGIYAYGLRDSTIRQNTITDPFSEVAIQIATSGGQVASNLTIQANTIRGATNAIYDQALSGSLALRFFGNDIQGYTGNAYNLGATTGSEITIRTFDTHGGTNQLATLGNLNVASNSLYSAIGSGAGGTNNPVLSASPSVAIIANQTARAMFTTNASFSWTITGASNQSTIVEVELANTSTNTIFATNALAPHVVEYGSNVTTLAIAPTSKLITRSWLNRSNEWVMTTLGAPYALTFSGSGVTLTTNHTTKTVDAAISSSGGSSTFNETNITVSTTNEVVLNIAAFDIARIKLLTNLNRLTFSNSSTMVKRAQVYLQQDTNGTRTIANWAVAGGVLQMPTNATTTLTTNANAGDLLELMPGFFPTNVFAWWPQDFHPRVGFTNSLASGALAFNYALSNVAANAYSAWSPARLLTNAWSSALALVVRSSDGATNYIVANNATNNLPTIVSWAGSANVYVTNLFDQTGNGRHMVNGATNTCPVIITNGVPVTKNGFFVMRFLDDDFLSTASLAPSLPLTYVVSVLNDSRTAGDMIFFGNSSSRTVIKQGSTAVYTITSGALDVSTTDALTLDQWDVVTAIFQTGDDVVQLDNGTEVTGGAGDNTPTALAIGSSTIAADMQVSDIFVYNSALTSAQYGILRTNVVNFYQHP